MRIFALSDVHVDYPENMARMQGISGGRYLRDTLLLAGDVSHDLDKLAQALRCLREKFAHVFFVPGNHDLWLRRGDAHDSTAKFRKVLRLCAGLAVATGPAKVVSGPDDPGAWVVPLFSWYVKPEQGADSLFVPRDGDDASLSMWADEVRTRWPERLSVADYFLDMNEPHRHRRYDAPVISFSHFLPRRELLFRPSSAAAPAPPGRFRRFNFSRVAGAARLDVQIRALGSILHVYGHQHRNRDRVIDGLRYVSHCMGYPRERARSGFAGAPRKPRLVWDTRWRPRVRASMRRE